MAEIAEGVPCRYGSGTSIYGAESVEGWAVEIGEKEIVILTDDGGSIDYVHTTSWLELSPRYPSETAKRLSGHRDRYLIPA